MSPHFWLLGVPVHVHGSFWLTAAILGLLNYQHGDMWAIAPWVLIVFLAVLLHEMGHALMAKRFGLQPEVHLIAMGGQTVYPAGRALTHWRSFLVSFAGPAVGLVIGGATWYALSRFPMPHAAQVILEAVVWTNFGWAVFNLLPIIPLDGGMMMAAVLDRFFSIRGRRWARVISMVVACALAALGLAVGAIFIVFFMALYAFENYRQWQAESRWAQKVAPQAPGRSASAARQAPQPSIEVAMRDAWAALEAGDSARVRRIAEALTGRARTEDERFEHAHLLGWGRLLEGDARGAAQALSLLPKGRLPDALLEGAVLHATGRSSEAVKPLAEAIVDRPDDFVSGQLAKAAAASGRYEEVLALIRDQDRSEKVGARAFQIVSNEAFFARHYEVAAALGEQLFERFGQASDAFNTACALGKAGRSAEALGWLERAIDKGLSDPSVLDTDADLEPVRALPEFADLRARAGLKL